MTPRFFCHRCIHAYINVQTLHLSFCVSNVPRRPEEWTKGRRRGQGYRKQQSLRMPRGSPLFCGVNLGHLSRYVYQYILPPHPKPKGRMRIPAPFPSWVVLFPFFFFFCFSSLISLSPSFRDKKRGFLFGLKCFRCLFS